MKLQHPPNGHRLKEELARAVARAEAAEKMAGQWLQLVTLRDSLIFELESQLESETAQRLAAERRVQELGTQLAAQAWRPVTDEPAEAEKDGYFWTWNKDEHDHFHPNWQKFALRVAKYKRDGGYDPETDTTYHFQDWRDIIYMQITHYIPLPAPPIDPPAPA